MDASLPVQKGIYDALNGTISCPVHDNPPTDAAMPYVVIGDETQVPDDTKTSAGFEVTQTVHVWSAKPARAEAKSILSEIYDVLHDGVFAVAGFDLVRCGLEFSNTIPDRDAEQTHGVARYRIVLDRAA